MAAATARPKDDDEMWGILREHHADLAGVKSDVAGVKRDVGVLGETVSRYGAKLDEVLSAVQTHASRQGPGLMQIMSGLGLLLAIVGGLSTGIAVFVGNMYGGQIATLQSDLSVARAAMVSRQDAEMTELFRLREDRFLALGTRLERLESNAGWNPR